MVHHMRASSGGELMEALAFSLLAKFWPVILGIGAVALAYLKGRSSGKQTERNAQAAREAHARDEAAEIDDAIAGRSPDANRDRLKKWRPK